MIRKLLKLFFQSKFYFDLKNADVLIYDYSSSGFLKDIIKKNKYQFFFSRLERFNAKIFFSTLLKSGSSNFGNNYFFNFIKATKPKIIISLWSINKCLYDVKRLFPHIKVIIIQGHNFDVDIFKRFKKFPKNSFDFFFVYNKFERSKLGKIFEKKKIHSIGSLKNNLFSRNPLIKKKKFIYLSSYKINNVFPYNDTKFMLYLDKFCLTNNLKFDIQTRYSKITNKYVKFIESLNFKTLDTILVKNDHSTSYKNMCKYKFVASSASTLANEALASGKRVALLASFSNFSNREYFLKNNIEKKFKFGFELKAKAKAKSGFFWSGKMSEKEALRILDNVVYSNNQKWKIELRKIKNLMLYDYYNKVFFKKMKKINFPIKERFNTNVKK